MKSICPMGVCALLALSAPAAEAQVPLEGGTVGMARAETLRTALTFNKPELEALLCPGSGSGTQPGVVGGCPGSAEPAPGAISGATCKPAVLIIEPGDPGEPNPPSFGEPWDDSALVMRIAPPQWTPGGDRATAALTPEKFCSRSAEFLPLSCGNWFYEARIDPAGSPSGTLELDLGDPLTGEGSFWMDVTVPVIFSFTNWKGNQTVKMTDELSFFSRGSWSTSPGLGAVVEPSSFAADTDCDGEADVELPATSNIAFGWEDLDGDGVPDPSSFCLAGKGGAGSVCLDPLVDLEE